VLKCQTCGDGAVSRVHIGRAAFFCDVQKNFAHTLIRISADAATTSQPMTLEFQDFMSTTSWQPSTFSHYRDPRSL
jgi:hypothetical protein